MPSKRAPGQKPIIVMMKEEFIAEIDGNLGKLGYGDRASLIRAAVIEKMISLGIEVPKELSLAPSRAGKGGRPPKYKKSKGVKKPPQKKL
ncbi:MAG TPA: hypothetical protein VGC39_00850 [Candidatus Methylacidiphilales bacterium]